MQTFPGAKRLECVELAPAFGAATFDDSASELDALQTLRVTEMPLVPYASVFKAAHAKPGGLHRTLNSNSTKLFGGKLNDHLSVSPV